MRAAIVAPPHANSATAVYFAVRWAVDQRPVGDAKKRKQAHRTEATITAEVESSSCSICRACDRFRVIATMKESMPIAGLNIT
jgi:hypothetical protein